MKRLQGEVTFMHPLKKCLVSSLTSLALLWASSRVRADLQEPEPLPLPRQGVIAGKGLRVRARPSLTATVVGQFKGGESVYVLFESSHTTKVDGKENPWFQILDRKGTFGWAYGGFIKVDPAVEDEKQAYLFSSLGGSDPGQSLPTNRWEPDQLEVVRNFDVTTRDLFIAYQCMRALRGSAYSSVPLKQLRTEAAFAISPLISSCQRIRVEDYDNYSWSPSPHIDVLKAIAVSTQTLIERAKAQLASGQYEGTVIDYIDLMEQLGGKDGAAIIEKLKSEFISSSEELGGGENSLVSELKKRISNDQLVSFLLKGTKSEDLSLKKRSVDSLTQCDDLSAALPRLIALLKDSDEGVRLAAATGITKAMPNAAAVDPLIQALSDESQPVRFEVLKALGKGELPINGKSKVASLIKDEDENIRYLVVSLFANDPNGLMQPPLSEASRDDSVRIRWKVEGSISALGTVEAKAFLDGIRSEKWEKSRAAWKWVKKVSPEKHFTRGDEIVVTLTRPSPGQSYRGFLGKETCYDCETETHRREPPSELELTEFASKKRDSAGGTETWTIRTGELSLEGDPFPETAGNYFLRFTLGNDDPVVIPFWLP